MAGKKMADSGYQYDIPADRGRVSRASGYKQRPLGPSDEDRLRWQQFLTELPERIDQMRAEDGPVCRGCGGPAPAVPVKWCPDCDRVLSVEDFNRNRARKDGRDQYCRRCMAQHHKRTRTRRALRLVIGRAS